MNLIFEHENFFHPCVIPFRGKLILLMSKITAMDRFTPPYFCFSEDGGKTWTKPEQIPTLKDVEKCADFRPIKLSDDNKIMIIGLVSNGADKDAPYSGYKTVYLSFDGEWSKPQNLLEKEEYNHRVACAQTELAADGSIIIPIYFDSPKKGGFKVQTRKFILKDGTLVQTESGNVLNSGIGNGWHEPSVTAFNGKYYLTLRCTTGCAWLAVSNDGLNWKEPKKWTFSDGTLLETGPTQQHWMHLDNKLWLVYTRKDESNEDCFRWRTPMFAAPVDPEKMQLVKEKEILVFPRTDYKNRPGLYGNFHVENCKGKVYISDAPLWFDWTADREAIAWFSTSVVIREIKFGEFTK